MLNNDFRQANEEAFLRQCRRRQAANRPTVIDRLFRWTLILLFVLLGIRAGGWVLTPVLGLIDVLDQPAPVYQLSQR
ncbi:hypothetical protein TspCOW1_21470 [Thiohalobacter sp. COW1]|uniref:hypothetical protein n=1 Tax=Thiohalobacter sp. COW1 TaxID=2795687 RepID=UPI0019159130|nr:hypothetical protein [Thiohalobacter sp. COW1]BCO32044.1 hypothetical protein TspCOW1_21470 [Thiohalobacter sp. COW1]